LKQGLNIFSNLTLFCHSIPQADIFRWTLTFDTKINQNARLFCTKFKMTNQKENVKNF